MKKPLSLAVMLFLGIPVVAGSAVFAAGTPQPSAQGPKLAALVNGEPITMAEYNEALVSLHTGAAEGKKAPGKDTAELLRRLIDIRLVVQEGRKIGLDELPEVKNMVDVYSRVTLREQLIEKQAKGVKAREQEVAQAYRDATTEWKLSSIIFTKEADARMMAEELKSGKSFAELSKEAVAAKTAKGGEEHQYVKVKDVNPEIAAIVSRMKPVSLSPVIPIKTGFVLVELEDIRQVDSPEEKESARWEALKDKRMKTLKDYNAALIKKYARVHKDILDQIDYEAKEPGFEKLSKDKRVVAEIQGEKPITVGELTEQIRQQLFHGVDRAVESKRINAKKTQILDEMLYKRVFRKEALRLGLDKTARYKYLVKEYENSVIFGAFVQKAVVPDVKLKEEELKAYYQEHIKEYTSPEMMRIWGCTFNKRADAEAAVEKLRKGTDFQWLKANAEGQADKNRNDLLVFDGRLLTTNDLPEDLQKVLKGVTSGDSRVFASPEGLYYALLIEQVVPSKPKPYEEAREEIAKKVFNEKLKKAMDEWTGKLRAAADIKIYLKQ